MKLEEFNGFWVAGVNFRVESSTKEGILSYTLSIDSLRNLLVQEYPLEYDFNNMGIFKVYYDRAYMRNKAFEFVGKDFIFRRGYNHSHPNVVYDRSLGFYTGAYKGGIFIDEDDGNVLKKSKFVDGVMLFGDGLSFVSSTSVDAKVITDLLEKMEENKALLENIKKKDGLYWRRKANEVMTRDMLFKDTRKSLEIFERFVDNYLEQRYGCSVSPSVVSPSVERRHLLSALRFLVRDGGVRDKPNYLVPFGLRGKEPWFENGMGGVQAMFDVSDFDEGNQMMTLRSGTSLFFQTPMRITDGQESKGISLLDNTLNVHYSSKLFKVRGKTAYVYGARDFEGNKVWSFMFFGDRDVIKSLKNSVEKGFDEMRVAFVEVSKSNLMAGGVVGIKQENVLGGEVEIDL